MSIHTVLPGCARPRDGRTHAPDAHFRLASANWNVNDFIEQCFTDSRGEPVRQGDVHRELQAHLDTHPKALIELPRDHGKSFQVCCRVLWELGKNPDLRVKIVCATTAVAAERSRFLRDTIAQNAAVREALPKLRASKPWSDRGFTLQRDSQSIGPSVAAFGIGAGSTGTRADLLVCDDVVDVRAIRSRAERDRVSDYFTNNLMNLLEPDGRFWGLCTPWHELRCRHKAQSSTRLIWIWTCDSSSVRTPVGFP